jgi:hypothetical protein
MVEFSVVCALRLSGWAMASLLGGRGSPFPTGRPARADSAPSKICSFDSPRPSHFWFCYRWSCEGAELAVRPRLLLPCT